MDEHARIEFLILANHVEAVNGLLYISGGGWTDHFRPPVQSPQQVFISHMGVGLSLYIPWNETNQEHRLRVRVEDQDARVVITEVETQVTVGRPPTLPKGEAQHAVVAMTIDTTFPKAGTYRVLANLNGDEGDYARWTFRVHDVAAGVALPPRHGR